MAQEFLQNKTNGTAIAAVKGVYFYKHVDSEEPIMVDALDSNNPESRNWFSVLTLRGTVNVSQDAPTIEKILVDQFDAPIGITTEPGDFTFEAQLPSLAENDLLEWLGQGLNKHAGKSIKGKQLLSFNLDGKIIETSVLIETATGAFIAFSNCQVVLSFMKEDKVFGIRLNGQVLAAEKEENDMVYIATEKMIVPVSGVTLNKSTLSLAVGEEETLTATVAPENASNKKLTWTSSDDTKVEVDQYGKVTAKVATGSGASNAVTITATAQGAGEGVSPATCAVTVTAASQS